MRKVPALALALAAFVLQGCSQKSDSGGGATPAPAAGRIKIGLSLDTLKEERWQRDRDLFLKAAEKLGAEVLVQAANSDDSLQNAQAENLLTQGVQVLVVVPHNAKTTATIVESAHKMGVPVIAYDRLIRDSDLDYYVTFDPVRVGELQAEYAVQHKPTGNYVLIGGAPTDNNAVLVREGQLKVLKPLIDKGDIKVVGDQWAKDWQPVEALKIMENALTRNQNKVDAVVVSNDGTAGGVIQALGEQKLTGKVLVTGQDADLAACQRIVAGTQTMTVYKPIKTIATDAANLAVAMAKGDTPTFTSKMNNGRKDVDTILLEPTALTKQNVDLVVKDGFYTQAQVGP